MDKQEKDPSNPHGEQNIVPGLYHPGAGASRKGAEAKLPLLSRVPLLRWDQRELNIKSAEFTDLGEPHPLPNLKGNRKLPDPAVWSRNMARVIFDVLAARRDISTIRRWVEPRLYSRLQTRISAHPRPMPQTVPARVLSGRLCYLSDHIVESSVVIKEQDRSRAVAMRLEAFRGRWKITALEIG